MTLLSSAMQAALGALASAAGQTVEYRSGTSGSWAALPNAFLEQTMPQEIRQDENARAVVVPARAMLRIAGDSPRLTPGTVLKPGHFIRHTVGSTVTVWGVVGASHIDGVALYDCEHRVPSTIGNVPGSVP